MNVDDFVAAGRDIRDAFRLNKVWLYLARHDVFARYRRSLLGPLWVSGSMVATSFALSIVMGSIFHQPLALILPYITSGILCWTVAGLPFLEGPEIFVQSASLIKTNPFPYAIYPLRALVRNLWIFANSLVVYLIISLIFRHNLNMNWQVVFGIPVLFLFGTFYGSIAGIAAARYRDLRFLLPYLGQIVFFLTPIFWRVSQVNGPKSLIVRYNVFYYAITVAREPLLGNAVPLDIWIPAVSLTILGGVILFIAFALTRRRLAFWV